MAKLKVKKRLIITTAALLTVGFFSYQLYLYISRVPNVYNRLVSEHVREIERSIYLEFDNWLEVIPESEILCGLVDFLHISQEQPFIDYGIELLYDERSGAEFFYGVNQKDFLSIQEDYLGSNECIFVVLVNRAIIEKPEGVYHSYNFGKDIRIWWTITIPGIYGFSDNIIPPIPGCFYDVENKRVLVPDKLLPTYKAIYPNAVIPPERIIEGFYCE